jgi:hypothetical protein
MPLGELLIRLKNVTQIMEKVQYFKWIEEIGYWLCVIGNSGKSLQSSVLPGNPPVLSAIERNRGYSVRYWATPVSWCIGSSTLSARRKPLPAGSRLKTSASSLLPVRLPRYSESIHAKSISGVGRRHKKTGRRMAARLSSRFLAARLSR